MNTRISMRILDANWLKHRVPLTKIMCELILEQETGLIESMHKPLWLLIRELTMYMWWKDQAYIFTK